MQIITWLLYKHQYLLKSFFISFEVPWLCLTRFYCKRDSSKIDPKTFKDYLKNVALTSNYKHLQNLTKFDISSSNYKHFQNLTSSTLWSVCLFVLAKYWNKILFSFLIFVCNSSSDSIFCHCMLNTRMSMYIHKIC